MSGSAALAEIGRVDATAWRRLGMELVEDGQCRAAVAAFNEAIRCSPADGETWLALADTYCRIGRMTAARAALCIALVSSAPASEIQQCLRRIMMDNRVRLSEGAEERRVRMGRRWQEGEPAFRRGRSRGG